MSDHAGDISHDSVSDFLKKKRITPRHLRNEVKDVPHDSDESRLIIDDSVRNKQYSGSIELVKLQYSGAAGGTVAEPVRLIPCIQTVGSTVRSITGYTPKRLTAGQKTIISKRC